MRRKATKAVAAAAASLSLAVLSAPASAADLRVVTLPDYKPFSGPDLPGKGLCNDAATKVFERAGHNVTVDLMPWNRAVKVVKSGNADVLSCVWKSSDPKEKFLDFPKNFVAQNRIVFAKPAGSDFQFKNLQSLKGMTVATVKGYGYNDKFKNAGHFKRQAAGSLVNNLRKLVRGRVDLAVGDELVMKYVVNQNMPGRSDKIAYTDGAMSVNDLYVAPAKANDMHAKLVKQWDKTVKAMKNDGSWNEMLAAHGLAG